jgi:hypothetical protein
MSPRLRLRARTLATLTASPAEINEGDVEDTYVGTLQNTTTGSRFEMTDTAGGCFKLDGEDIVAGATLTDFNTAESHTITVVETNVACHGSPKSSDIEITVVAAVTGVERLPPVIEWQSSVADDPPTIGVVWGADTVAGDEADFFKSTDGVTREAWFTHTISAGDLTGDFTMAEMTALGDGVFQIDCEVNGGSPSNSFVLLISATPAGAHAVGNVTRLGLLGVMRSV